MRITNILLFLFIVFNTYGQEYYVTTADLNIREGAGLNYDTVYVLVIGDTIELLDSSNGNWVHIKYKDRLGYVSKKYLEKIDIPQQEATSILTDQNIETSEDDYSSFFAVILLLIVIAYLINKLGKKSRNKTLTSILSLFFGSFGMQYFYLNMITIGVLSVLFSWTFIPMFIGIIDSIRFAIMKDEKFILLYHGSEKAVRMESQKRNYNATLTTKNTSEELDMLSNNKSIPSKYINEDKTIIDVNQEDLDLSVTQFPINNISSDKDFSTEVPYWKFSYVYSNRELNKATKAQKDFYQYFKNKILEGEFVDIQGNSNYAFILYYDLLDAYQRHKDIQLLERQFDLLGQVCTPTKGYILNSLKFQLSKRTDSYSIDRLNSLEDPVFLYQNNYSDYNPDLYKLGTLYKDKLPLDEKEVQWLNKFYRPSNVFLNIEECCVAVIEQYLLVIKYLEKRLLGKEQNLVTRLNYFKNKSVDIFEAKNTGWSSSYTSYYVNQAESEIFTVIFKSVENSVRESFGHRRKLSEELTSYEDSLKQEFEDKIGSILRDIIIELSSNIAPPSPKAQIALNSLNINRWKREFKKIKNNFNIKNKALFLNSINDLERANHKNPNIENIFFEASKFIAKYDKQQALVYYSKYVNYNLKSAKLKRKKLTKAAEKRLFSTDEQREEFNEIIADLMASQNLKHALEQVSKIYISKRRKIDLNPQRIQEAKERHKGTVELLNDYLNDEDSVENRFENIKIIENIEVTTIPIIEVESMFIVGIKMNSIQEELLKNIADNNYEIKQQEVEQYALQHGMFKNQLIDSINEACEEVLGGEALIEEEDDNYIIEESFYQEIIQ